MKSLSYTTLLTITFIFAASCSKKWMEENPPNLITAETLYTSLDGFEAGLNGLYSFVRREREATDGSGSDNLIADIAMLGTDNMVPNARGGFGLVFLTYDSRNIPTDARTRDVFLWLYQIVNAANTIINRAEAGADIDWKGAGGTNEQNKNRVLAEAKAIRAWAYRHLVYSWGEVPLSLEESQGSNIRTDWKRAPVTEIRSQMKRDWIFAEQHLSIEPSVRGKISKGAVQHYLAELSLTEGRADSALIWADKCINTPKYQLVTKRYGAKAGQPGVAFMDMFQDGNSNREEGNTEALWVWQWEYNIAGGGGSIMRRYFSATATHLLIAVGGVNPLQFTIDRGGRGIGRNQPTKWAINLYEPKDDRGSNYAIRKYYLLQNAADNAPAPADNLPAGYKFGDTIKLNWTNDLSGTSNASRNDYPFIRKWDNVIPTNLQENKQYNDQVYLRLAETFLIKAEAQFRLGNLAGAAQTINVIRARANASNVTAANITLDFILDERSRELIGEEHRRYTLLRTRTWLDRVRAYNKRGGQTAAARDTLLPIPQVVIDANLTEKMPQNPGF